MTDDPSNTTSDEAASAALPEFSIAFWSEAGWIFSPKGTVSVEVTTEYGPAIVHFGTRTKRFKGVKKPAAMGIYAFVVGNAKGMQSANNLFTKVADNVGALLALLTNAGFEAFRPWHGFESTPSSPKRIFFVSKPPGEALLPIARRDVPRFEIETYINNLFSHPEIDRIQRAIAHYLEVLRLWAPGKEMTVLNHAYMGIETLTPILLKQEREKAGLAHDWELAKSWGIAVPPEQEMPDAAKWQIVLKRVIHAVRDINARQWRNDLNAEVRRRTIFGGDAKLYKDVTKAYNGLKHGYASLDKILTVAVERRSDVASCLRLAILNLLTPDAIPDVLTKTHFAQPLCLAFNQSVFGNITGAKNMIYTRPLGVTWESQFKDMGSADGEYARIDEEGKVTMALPHGAVLEDTITEVQRFNDEPTTKGTVEFSPEN